MTDDQAALPLQFSEHALWGILEQVQREVADLQARVADTEVRVTDLEDNAFSDDDDWVPPGGPGRRWRTYDTDQPCVDCGAELLPDTPPGSKDWQRFMVHDEVWQAAGLDRGWICVDCLETRLGRPLTGADLVAHLRMNDPDFDDEDTPRLKELKRDAARMARSEAT